MTIGPGRFLLALRACGFLMRGTVALRSCRFLSVRSEEHTSELQSRSDLVCRLLLEKKKKIMTYRVYQEQKTSKNICLTAGSSDVYTREKARLALFLLLRLSE